MPEYLTRKIEAMVMTLGGAFLAIVSLVGGFYAAAQGGGSSAVIAGFIFAIIFGIVAIYGSHLWNKITHIMWTRQALREYGIPSIFKGGSELLPESREEELDLEKKEVEQYLDLIEKQYIEGKVSEENYKELREKYEKRLKQITKKKTITDRVMEFEVGKREEERIGFRLNSGEVLYGNFQVAKGDIFFKFVDSKEKIYDKPKYVTSYEFRFNAPRSDVYYAVFDNLHSLFEPKKISFKYRTDGLIIEGPEVQCKFCGAQMKSGTIFCPICGKSQQ